MNHSYTVILSRKGLLEESETIALAKKINSQLSTVRLRQKIQEFSIESGERTGRIDQRQFVSLFKDLATRPEVFFLMVRYSGKDYFARDDLHFFLEGEQEMETIEEDVSRLIDEFEPSEEARTDEQMLLDGFTLYLLSQYASLMPRSHVHHDMTQPFTHYFISTWQIEDESDVLSSVEGYVQALTQGCRCVKIDLSLNEIANFVVGGTLPLQEVLDTIRDFAFAASKYPLIVQLNFSPLSHEDACRLAQKLRISLGEHLYISSATGANQPFSTNLSPESLKHKILLYFTSPSAGGGNGTGIASNKNNDRRKEGGIGFSDEWDFAHSASELAELATLNQFNASSHCIDLATQQNQQMENEVCVLSETAAIKLCHTLADELVHHSKRFLTQVEPSSDQIENGANQVNPLELWAAGIQMDA
ncbi:inactive phospholipase C protein 2-like [Tropilaelaps mercedesae]|uniref:Phosphoinositide phospholipase C n=1 Tax=Tropilaelaps mercedesae TaxID=418985 RepID=A0A1V9Y326_9ACAR|nr:inactive phospholipase C protein 2-like [Tropilaelaps mercedesae]